MNVKSGRDETESCTVWLDSQGDIQIFGLQFGK